MSPTQGARLSNTGPSNDKLSGNSPKLLTVASGVDTLILTVRGDVPDDLECSLADLRSSCVAGDVDTGRRSEVSPVVTPYLFFDEPLYLSPYGRKSWRYVLHNELADIQLVRGGVAGICASVRLSAAALWSRGVDLCAVEAQRFVYDLLGSEAEVIVSELHLARDLAGRDVGEEWSDIRPCLVKRAVEVQVVDKHNRVETVNIGSRDGDVSAILYDKLSEIQVSHKLWMETIWRSNGWDSEAPVWRLEFRMRRGFLRQVGIRTVDDLLEKLGGCWEYCVEKWLRHAVPVSGDSRRWRWPVSVWWGVYSAPFEQDEDTTAVVRDTERCAEADALLAQAAGCLIGVAAKVGLADESEAAGSVLARFADLCLMTGLTFPQLVERRDMLYKSAA
jgi:hypothetical protein